MAAKVHARFFWGAPQKTHFGPTPCNHFKVLGPESLTATCHTGPWSGGLPCSGVGSWSHQARWELTSRTRCSHSRGDKNGGRKGCVKGTSRGTANFTDNMAQEIIFWGQFFLGGPPKKCLTWPFAPCCCSIGHCLALANRMSSVQGSGVFVCTLFLLR